MRRTKLTILILCCILSLQLFSCMRNTPPPDDIYSDSYTISSAEQYRSLNSAASITEIDAVNTALSNNPEYKIKQLQAVSAEAGYYSSLINLTPNVSIGNNSRIATTTYQANPSSIINILTAKAYANKALYDTDNYRREMVKDINLTYNDMQKSKSIAAIQKENEGFQKKMAKNIVGKKKSTADILNFKINELKAKAATIETEKNYKINSYALAANMGMTSAELPADISAQKSVSEKSLDNDQNRLGLNYYLDIAIENRPDLKAHKEALRAAKYDLYAAAGVVLTPTVNAATGNSNSSVSASKNITHGSNIAEIRSKDADYAGQQEDMQKKWISVIKEVKEAYLKLTTQLAVRKILKSTMQMAKLRRDLVAKQYNTGKTKGIATLNQAQKDLVNAQKSFIKAEKDLSVAKSELYTACGIPNYGTKKPSITTLNQAQYDYVNAEKNYVDKRVEVLKAETSLNTATAIQR